MTGDLKEFYIGNDVSESKRNLNVCYPIKEGQVSDWNVIEKMLKHTTYEILKTSPEEHPWIMTETPTNSDSNRLELADTMFIGFNAP